MILPIYAHSRPLEPEALHVDTTELKVHLHDNSEDHSAPRPVSHSMVLDTCTAVRTTPTTHIQQ